jgi:hypothetical protein
MRISPVIMVIVLALLPCRLESAELQTPAWKAASFVKGIYASYIYILHVCQEIDGKNVDAYNKAIASLAAIANPALNQAEKVMRGEAQRAGKDADWLAEANQENDQIALLTAEGEKKHPEKLLSDCRFTPEQAKDHVGIFAPLRDQFPRQMHMVEQWH